MKSKKELDQENEWRKQIIKEMENEISLLKSIVMDTLWMSRRYSHGRSSYAVSQCNDAIDLALKLGLNIEIDGVTKEMYAKDGMFDKEWFEKYGRERQL